MLQTNRVKTGAEGCKTGKTVQFHWAQFAFLWAGLLCAMSFLQVHFSAEVYNSQANKARPTPLWNQVIPGGASIPLKGYSVISVIFKSSTFPPYNSYNFPITYIEFIEWEERCYLLLYGGL